MAKPIFDLSLVIACYNEEPILEESINQVIEILDTTIWSYEIIFVDDCSQDRTRELIEKIISSYPGKNIRKLYHKNNSGRGGAVSDGFRMALGEVVGYIDIDLEVYARYIPSFVIAAKNGADLVTAHRIYRSNFRLFHRFLLSRSYTALVQTLLGIQLNDTEAGFKFFKQEKLLPVLDEMEDQGWFWDTEVVARFLGKGYLVQEIPCLFLKRYDKKSSVRVIQDTRDYLIKILRFRKSHMNRQTIYPAGNEMLPETAGTLFGSAKGEPIQNSTVLVGEK